MRDNLFACVRVCEIRGIILCANFMKCDVHVVLWCVNASRIFEQKIFEHILEVKSSGLSGS